MQRVTFFYDLNSPYSWFAADRIDELFDVDVEWVPIFFGGLLRETGRVPWSISDEREDGMVVVAERAAKYGLPAPNYPEIWPHLSVKSMRVAVWAHSVGAGRRFARAAFEVHFIDGLSLAEDEAIELAAHRAGLDPQFALEAAEDPNVKQELKDNTAAALAAGVIGVPSVVVGDEVFWGDDQLEAAVAASEALR
jgi:2-hydroxychromene-2-carboxylate isomerase